MTRLGNEVSKGERVLGTKGPAYSNAHWEGCPSGEIEGHSLKVESSWVLLPHTDSETWVTEDQET